MSDNTARLTGVAHRSVTGQPTDRTASPDCCGRWWQPSRYASASGSSGVGREGDCRAAHRAIRFYTAKIRASAAKMGAAVPLRAALQAAAEGDRSGRCPRYLARILKRKAAAWRARYERWWAHTPKLSGETWRDVRLDSQVNRALLALARCETGYLAGGAVNWRHRNSTYVGGLGFAWSTWTHYRHAVKPLPPAEGSRATMREQLAVGRHLVRLYGYSPWPACSIRLGLR